MNEAAINLRHAVPADAALIFTLIRELAAYQGRISEVEANESMLAAVLFAKDPRVYCTLADYGEVPAGFILWYHTFSTFRGRHGIWIEDLYVREKFRGKSIGKTLLASVARRCINENLSRLEWAVLDWNTSAIAFYEAMGARLMREWTMCRLEGAALAASADGSRSS